MTDTKPLLQIDIISDVICPWCFIGKRKLDMVLSQLQDYRVNLIWRPFQLNPHMPDAGRDYKQQMQAKFGEIAGRAMRENLISVAQGTGISFNFEKITRIPNTLNAHRLIRWAAPAGAQHHVAEALFSAYFEHGQDVGDKNTLCAIAEQNGLDVASIEAMLDSAQDIQAIREDDAAARDMGVAGVPTILVGGRFLLSGAQEPETIIRFFTRALEKLQKQTETSKHA